jgi:uncharacterized protein
MGMSEHTSKHWLVSAWPGMGNVAVIAAGYLVHELGLKPVAGNPPQGRFDIERVDVKNGVIASPRLPQSVFYRAADPAAGGPLVFLSESQPSEDAYGYAHRLLEQAITLGADRVVTFASMATQLHPASTPRIFGAVTQPDMLPDLQKAGVQPLQEGQIGGLNGVILGAAAARGLPGVCLLGEIPYFAAGVPNPKAAMAVLKAFGSLSGVHADLSALESHAASVDQGLIDLLSRLREQSDEGAEGLPLPEEPAPETEPDTSEAEPSEAKPLDPAAQNRIEQLFKEARRNRSSRVKLKEELDRLRVFDRYENRFLDLFRRAA